MLLKIFSGVTMSNYYLTSDLQEKIWSRLIQLKAVSGLIVDQTGATSDFRHDQINGSAWLISECLDEIIQDLDNLPTEDHNAKGDNHE